MESLVNKLEKINKTYFTFKDIQKVSQQDPSVLKVSIFNLIKKGKLMRLKKGFYILESQNLDLEKIGQQLYSPSYISCEYALGKYGILNQKPYTYTFITTNKTKNLLIANQAISYQQIKKDLFFGFENINGILIASKEKALLDQLYLTS
jgi:predicted transcriptional regulator of viral defense system